MPSRYVVSRKGHIPNLRQTRPPRRTLHRQNHHEVARILVCMNRVLLRRLRPIAKVPHPLRNRRPRLPRTSHRTLHSRRSAHRLRHRLRRKPISDCHGEQERSRFTATAPGQPALQLQTSSSKRQNVRPSRRRPKTNNHQSRPLVPPACPERSRRASRRLFAVAIALAVAVILSAAEGSLFAVASSVLSVLSQYPLC